MHDQGPLVPPKEGGIYAQLLGCIEAAKLESDKLLTQIIEKEKIDSCDHLTEKTCRSEIDGGSPPLIIHENKKPRQDLKK
jgi:hypothetical protein